MDFYWTAWIMIIATLAGGVFTAILAVISLVPRFAREYKHPLKAFFLYLVRSAAELLVGLYLLNLLKSDQLHPFWIFTIVIILQLLNAGASLLTERIGKPAFP